jgi:crossover junction endodeoxyribonuclease RusA
VVPHVKFLLFVPGEIWTMSRERSIHHYDRAALVDDIRKTAKIACIEAIRVRRLKPYAVPVTVEFLPHQARKGGTLADTANHLPPCKAVLDGIVDAGLLVDDTPKWVVSQTFYPPVRAKLTGIQVLIKVAP